MCGLLASFCPWSEALRTSLSSLVLQCLHQPAAVLRSLITTPYRPVTSNNGSYSTPVFYTHHFFLHRACFKFQVKGPSKQGLLIVLWLLLKSTSGSTFCASQFLHSPISRVYVIYTLTNFISSAAVARILLFGLLSSRDKLDRFHNPGLLIHAVFP